MPHDEFDDEFGDEHCVLIGGLLMGVAALLVVALLVWVAS
jgi:hypothetical protein